MEYIKPFLWFWAGWFVGAFSTAYFLVQALIVLRVGIPMTLGGLREGFIKNRVPLVQYTISLVLLTVLFIATFLCVRYFGSGIFVIGFYVGIVLALYRGVPDSGANMTNINEFMVKNASYMDKKEIAGAMTEAPKPTQRSDNKQ
jgi:hypothetical protein